MKHLDQIIKNGLPLAAALLMLFSFSLAACASPQADATEPAGSDHNGAHDDEHSHEGDDHEKSARVPNDGAIVRIIAPTDGATFQRGEDIVVEIQVENFDLNAEGNHWHLYVDGSMLSMVAGGVTKSVLHDLEPGQHELEVYLGLPDHKELEEGAKITITVTE